MGFEAAIGSSASQLRDADAVLLPGVGNFSAASRNLASLREEILDKIKTGTPVLGICLGMQLLYSESEEGEGMGLETFQGKNIRLPDSVKVPHMGWNTLNVLKQEALLEDIENGSYVYFVHSYFPVPTDRETVAAETTYGVTFPSVVQETNVHGTQFHPEKSGECGSKILANLLEIVRR